VLRRSPRGIGQVARIAVLRLLIASMMITLFARLTYVQMINGDKPQQSAGLTHLGAVPIPAPRGEILDARGRVLVGNKTSRVLTVDRGVLNSLPDKGDSVLTKLGQVLGESVADLRKQITPCGVSVPAPCWIGQPFQPVPVADDINPAVVLAISEHGEDYPGVKVEAQTVLDYPNGSLAAHVLGYTGAVSSDDKKADKRLVDADTIGRSGLEKSYDSILRGVDGADNVLIDPRGDVVGKGTTKAPVAGDRLVTSIDLDVQKAAENALATEIAARRKAGYAAPSGALVVMDPHTGRIVAAASYPTYDPTLFVGGISVKDYATLTAPGSGDPLVGRAISGQYAPGSTFKLISLSDNIMNGSMSLDGQYPCPGSLNIDGRTKTNFDSESFGGAISVKFALGVSCDTFFYAPAANEYYADQARIDKGQKPLEQLQHMAAAFGVGSSPQVDLPADEQASGSMADRATRLERWQENKDDYCAAARKGYPNEPNATTRAYLTLLASENCTDGWRYRAGDNADMSIGQGETTMSPLQLAMAYSAMVNGGTLYAPTFGWGVVDNTGRTVTTIKPKPIRTLPVSKQMLAFFGDALHFDGTHSVSGAIAFDGSPIQTLIGGKTGTAEVYNKADTSWFASWGPVQPGAPASSARFVAVGMIEQAGLGSRAAAPAVRQVWEAILGANGSKPIIPGSRPASTLPKVPARAQVPLTPTPSRPVPTASATASTSASASSAPSKVPASAPPPTPDAVVPRPTATKTRR
jgi:penicillin-binding protein 2